MADYDIAFTRVQLDPAHLGWAFPVRRLVARTLSWSDAGVLPESGYATPSGRAVALALGMNHYVKPDDKAPNLPRIVTAMNRALAGHKPANLTAVADASGVTLTWEALVWNVPTEYRISRKEGDGDWMVLGTTRGLTFDDPDFDARARTTYRVTVLSPIGEGNKVEVVLGGMPPAYTGLYDRVWTGERLYGGRYAALIQVYDAVYQLAWSGDVDYEAVYMGAVPYEAEWGGLTWALYEGASPRNYDGTSLRYYVVIYDAPEPSVGVFPGFTLEQYAGVALHEYEGATSIDYRALYESDQPFSRVWAGEVPYVPVALFAGEGPYVGPRDYPGEVAFAALYRRLFLGEVDFAGARDYPGAVPYEAIYTAGLISIGQYHADYERVYHRTAGLFPKVFLRHGFREYSRQYVGLYEAVYEGAYDQVFGGQGEQVFDAEYDEHYRGDLTYTGHSLRAFVRAGVRYGGTTSTRWSRPSIRIYRSQRASIAVYAGNYRREYLGGTAIYSADFDAEYEARFAADFAAVFDAEYEARFAADFEAVYMGTGTASYQGEFDRVYTSIGAFARLWRQVYPGPTGRIRIESYEGEYERQYVGHYAQPYVGTDRYEALWRRSSIVDYERAWRTVYSAAYRAAWEAAYAGTRAATFGGQSARVFEAAYLPGAGDIGQTPSIGLWEGLVFKDFAGFLLVAYARDWAALYRHGYAADYRQDYRAVYVGAYAADYDADTTYLRVWARLSATEYERVRTVTYVGELAPTESVADFEAAYTGAGDYRRTWRRVSVVAGGVPSVATYQGEFAARFVGLFPAEYEGEFAARFVGDFQEDFASDAVRKEYGEETWATEWEAEYTLEWEGVNVFADALLYRTRYGQGGARQFLGRLGPGGGTPVWIGQHPNWSVEYRRDFQQAFRQGFVSGYSQEYTHAYSDSFSGQFGGRVSARDFVSLWDTLWIGGGAGTATRIFRAEYIPSFRRNESIGVALWTAEYPRISIRPVFYEAEYLAEYADEPLPAPLEYERVWEGGTDKASERPVEGQPYHEGPAYLSAGITSASYHAQYGTAYVEGPFDNYIGNVGIRLYSRRWRTTVPRTSLGPGWRPTFVRTSLIGYQRFWVSDLNQNWPSRPYVASWSGAYDVDYEKVWSGDFARVYEGEWPGRYEAEYVSATSALYAGIRTGDAPNASAALYESDPADFATLYGEDWSGSYHSFRGYLTDYLGNVPYEGEGDYAGDVAYRGEFDRDYLGDVAYEGEADYSGPQDYEGEAVFGAIYPGRRLFEGEYGGDVGYDDEYAGTNPFTVWTQDYRTVLEFADDAGNDYRSGLVIDYTGPDYVGPRQWEREYNLDRRSTGFWGGGPLQPDARRYRADYTGPDDRVSAVDYVGPAQRTYIALGRYHGYLGFTRAYNPEDQGFTPYVKDWQAGSTYHPAGVTAPNYLAEYVGDD